MRLIRLSDGRICQIQRGFTEREIPVGKDVALASITGEHRFGLQLPTQWHALHEAELRSLVETWMRANPSTDDRAAPRDAGAGRGLIGRVVRWLTPARGVAQQS